MAARRFGPSRSSAALRRVVRGVVAAWLLVFVELAAVAIGARARIASVWELQFGLLGLLPSVLAVAALAGIAGGLVLELFRRGTALSARVLLGILAGAFAGATAWALGGGRHLDSLSERGGFTVLVGLLAAVAAFSVAPMLARGIARWPPAVAFLALLLIAGLEIANRFVLVRLYPAFHVSLALLALLLAPLLGLLLEQPADSGKGEPEPSRGGWLAPVVVALIFVAAIATARPAAARLAYFDNFRLLLLEQAPMLGQGVRLAGELVAPAPTPSTDCFEILAPGEARPADCGPSTPASSSARAAIDLRGRDILLLSIDALRADHVGAYGYARRTTPNIDALAREGVLFEYAYAPTPHTSYSVTSLMTGKYMRPLLLQGAGQDSETWASLLRTYGYRTAAFYPPAVFFIDPSRFEAFRETALGFEYRKVEFLEGDARVEQVKAYLAGVPVDQRVFVWLHLFGPHEPYVAQAGHAFGDRDVDRYDSEIAAADATVGKVVAALRARRPGTVVIVTADHGEEFGEHGGRYHGTTVYEEQVRVPLVVVAPGAVPSGRRVKEPVQTIDILPTVLGELDIPQPARLRGRDLGELLSGRRPDGRGLVLAETEDMVLLGEDSLRLVCQRRLGACRIYDVAKDPLEQGEASGAAALRASEMRERLRELSASHGRYELRGLRAEGKGWPAPILRAATGDSDAAEEVAALLDDADLGVRRKAAELLFEIARKETAPALRLALGRDEDLEVRSWCALALTRMGQGAPLAFELAKSEEPRWKRLAALALAESGDKRGEETLIGWWKDEKTRDYSRSRQLLDALASIRSRDAVWPLVQSLDDVRLRPHIAAALAAIGEDFARVPLARALSSERYQSARVALAKALVSLGAEAELAEPLVRFLGVPDPLPGGLGFALDAKILDHIGGPDGKDLAKLRKQANLGVALSLIIPRGGNGRGVRAVARARASGPEGGFVHVGARLQPMRYDSKGQPIKRRDIPRIDMSRAARIRVPPGAELREVHAVLPEAMRFRAGQGVHFVVVADHNVELDAVALVPLADELPPPPPEPVEPVSPAPPASAAP